MIILIDNVLKSKNKTRNWLSNETGVTYANICNLCNGKTDIIKFTILDKICHVLSCSISDILLPEDIDIDSVSVLQEKINKLTQYSKGDTE